MAESTLSLSYDDFQREVGDFVGYGLAVGNWTSAQVAEVDAFIQSGLRQFYYPPAVEGVEVGYPWSFLKPTTTIETIIRPTPGSLAGVSGTCTITGGTWPSWAATHGALVIGSTEYAITTRNSSTVLTVVGVDVAAAQDGWHLSHAGYHDLPDDFGRVLGDFFFEPDVYHSSIPIVSEGKIQEFLQQSTDEGRPRYAAVRYKALATATSGQRQEIVWWPIPDAVYTLTYQYEAYQSKLVTATAQYPLGGMRHGETIMASCLALAEQRVNEEKGIHWDSFMRLLSASISQDRRSGARHFGHMGEPSSGSMPRHSNGKQTYDVTYDGETW